MDISAINLASKRARPENVDETPALSNKRQRVETSLSSQTTCTPISSEVMPGYSKQDVVVDMIRLVVEEFNCNH